MRLIILYFVALLAFIGIPGGANAVSSGFTSCESELVETGKVAAESWNSSSPTRKTFATIKRYVAEDDKVVRWVRHRNPNGTLTIVLEVSDPREDLDSFVVASETTHKVLVKEKVYAVGLGFSKKSRFGVSGLYFCSKQGISPEWVWNGSTWK